MPIISNAKDMHRGDDVLPSRPELVPGIAAMLETLKRERQLPARLVELIRLRIAFRNQCRTCMSLRYGEAVEDGLTERLVCSLEEPEEAADLSGSEKAAIAYADRFAVDHLAIDDQKRRLALYFTSEQIAVLAACFVGFGRLAAVFDTGKALPVGDFRADGALLTPWGIEAPTIAA